jgi:hypothetical protein
MRLVLQISEQTVLQLPLSLLYELNRVEMHDENLYIRIPFEALFSKINMVELQYSTVSFLLLDTQEINNYANSFSLISKVYIHDSNENSVLSNNNNAHSRRNTSTLIQQIGTLYMSIPNNQIVFNRRIFQIQTNILNGPTKGFLIQCHNANLTSIKFYINNLLRFDYDQYLIQSVCVKLSDNLLYMPFNDHNDFLDKDINTFSGAINLSRLENSTICLEFSQDQYDISIHNVYLNYFQQISGLSALSIDYRPAFIENSIYNHPIQPIIGTPLNSSMLDMSGNYIINRRTSLYSGTSSNSSYGGTSSNSSYGGTSSYSGRTGPFSRAGNYINSYTGSITETGTVTNEGVVTNEVSYPVPTGCFVFQVINPERNICNITHDEIGPEQQYMTCCNCHIHFLESALKRWLRARSWDMRTCPTCRARWANFTVYINRRNTGELD